MKLTTPRSFQSGNLQIPGAISNSPGVDSNVHLEALIMEYERELLIRVLGPEQYKIFLQVVDHVVRDWWGYTRLTDRDGNFLTFKDKYGRETYITTGDQVDHAFYSYADCDREITLKCWNELFFGNVGHWRGLQDMVTKYIWCQYQKFHAVEQSVLGPMVPESIGGARASNKRNFVDRWNEICVQYRYLQQFLDESPCFRPYWNMYDLFQTKTSIL